MREKRSTRAAIALVVALVAALCASPARAQDWRDASAHIGTTARVLVIGTRPADEDNALIAWLSLGRHVETAYLSLTRGESGVNLIGSERQFPLAAVRTAELLAERERDGAHQYFTRAYDIGPTAADSIVAGAWPHDSLLEDVVSVIRAFRPQVVISLADTAHDDDATHRFAARLAAEAFRAAADSVLMPSTATSRLPAWPVSQLYMRVDSIARGREGVAIDVGEFDRARGRSYAELGAQIRQLQRSSVAPPVPAVGPLRQFLVRDSTRAGAGAALFGAADTTLARFRDLPNDAQAQLDTLRSLVAGVEAAAAFAPADSLAARLARVAKRTSEVRLALSCGDIEGVPACPGAAGDLAVALNAIRARATRAMIAAAGVVIDGVVPHALVAAGDSVPVAVTVYNGGGAPVMVRRLAATEGRWLSTLVRDTAIAVLPDSAATFIAKLLVLVPSYHWWQINGLIAGTRLHAIHSPGSQPVMAGLIEGEDRIAASRVEATLSIGGVDVPVIVQPIIHRDAGAVRGDVRHPLEGVPPTSVILERLAEYQRASMPIDRLFRVYVWSARSTADTLAVTLRLPKGLRADSTKRRVVLPPFGAASVFFHLQGRIATGSDTVYASAHSVAAVMQAGRVMRVGAPEDAVLGVITHEYPHIPTQQFVRFANDRLEAVDVRVPPKLRVLYVKGTDDVQTSLVQLWVNVQALDPALLPVVDLSGFSTILIGAGALAGDAMKGAIPAVRGFLRGGGTVVVLPNGRELAASGIMPYGVAFDSIPARVGDPSSVLRAIDPGSPLLTWPNAITEGDFAGWVEERARDVPAWFDPRYRTVVSTGDRGRQPTAATLLWARVGKGTIVYTSLALDEQLAATHPGAVRLMINLLSAGLNPARSR